MKKLFKQNKIKIQGGYQVVHRKVYKKYRIIARYQSPELSEMLGPVLRDSDNLYAESILKTLGWKFTNVGSFQEGVNSMQDLLEKKLDIDFVHSDLFDGSGASRYDQVTPELMARLLYVMYHDRKLYRHFYRGLPDAGFNGTLQNRMTSFDLKKMLKPKQEHSSTFRLCRATCARRARKISVLSF